MEDRAEYFSIAQVADILGVTKETLRRWDDNGTMVAQRVESNNYRVYHDVTADKIVFFPHGMDQMFGTAYNILRPPFNGMSQTDYELYSTTRQIKKEPLFAYMIRSFFRWKVLGFSIQLT